MIEHKKQNMSTFLKSPWRTKHAITYKHHDLYTVDADDVVDSGIAGDAATALANRTRNADVVENQVIYEDFERVADLRTHKLRNHLSLNQVFRCLRAHSRVREYPLYAKP